MPGMNGLECVEQIRKLNYKMPVILSTGSLSVESSTDIEKAGVTSLVQSLTSLKPCYQLSANLSERFSSDSFSTPTILIF